MIAEFERYAALYPDEEQERYRRFINTYGGEELYHRKNFDGHITASGIVLDTQRRSMLMLDHVQLKKWLQPGGHVDAEDSSVFAAAQREIEEETGIAPERLTQLLRADNGFAIIDIDSHYIPPSDKKREDEHYHHDVRYLFALNDGDLSLKIALDESAAARWVALDEIPSYWGFDRIKRKLAMYK